MRKMKGKATNRLASKKPVCASRRSKVHKATTIRTSNKSSPTKKTKGTQPNLTKQYEKDYIEDKVLWKKIEQIHEQDRTLLAKLKKAFSKKK